MTQEEKNILRAQIRHDIEVIKEQIEILQEKAKPIAPDCSLGRLTRMEAMAEQEVSQKILDESTLRLTRLLYAFVRIDKPMFGICIECEEKIGIERMKIRPESVRCVKCASEQ